MAAPTYSEGPVAGPLLAVRLGHRGVLAASVAWAAGAAVVMAGPGDRHTAALVMNAAIVALSAAGGVLCWRRARHEPEARTSWRLLGGVAGMGTLAAGLALGDIAGGGSVSAPLTYPSAGDLLNVPFVLLLAVAHLLWPLAARPRRVRVTAAVDGFLFGLASLVISWAFALGPLAMSSAATPLTQVSAISNWVATAVWLGILAYVLVAHPAVMRGPIGWFGLAAALAAVGSLLLAVLALEGRYYIGHPADIPGMFGYVAAIAATLSRRPAVPDTDRPRPRAPLVLPLPHAAPPAPRGVRAAPSGWVTDTLPYWAVVVALPIAVTKLVQTGGRDKGLAALTALLVVVVIVRQFLALRDLRALSNNLEGEVNQRTAELERSLAALSRTQRLEAVGKLAGGIAHDFNNVLTVIAGCSDALRRGTAKPGGPEHQLIEGAIAQATRLTRQLVTFSRHGVVTPKVVRPGQVVADMEPLLRRALGDAVELTLEIDAAAGPVRIDPGQLEQVVLNLAVNARDAMPEGGRLSVAVGATEGPPRRVRLRMVDTGAGMSPEVIACAFEPFFTTKEANHGSGLGLSTVHGIVAHAGGTVDLTSIPGEGTTVDVWLPAVEARPEMSASPARRPANGPGNETVLVVDDNSSIRVLLARALEAEGYVVLLAADGRQAVEVARAHEGAIHLLVSDAVMPRLSGPAAADIIKRDRPEMAVIFISAHAGDDLTATRLRGASVLPKPFTPEDLVARVRDTLDRAHPARV